MKKIFLFIVSGVITTALFAQEKVDNLTPQERLQLLEGIGPAVAGSESYSQLPAKAKSFLISQYPNSKVLSVLKEFGTGDLEVKLDNGVEVEFTSKGLVKEIESELGVLSVDVVKSILPRNVVKAIATQTTCDDIKKIEIERKGIYELEFMKCQKVNLKGMKVSSKGKILKTE